MTRRWLKDASKMIHLKFSRCERSGIHTGTQADESWISENRIIRWSGVRLTLFWFSLALPFRTGTQTMLHWRIETQRHILLSGIRFSQRSNNSDLNKNFKLLTDSLSLCFLNIHSVGYTRQNDEFFFYVFFLPLERECEWWWMVVSSTNAFKRQFRWSKWPPNESSDKQEPEDAQVDA